jgi:hypothetical protein
MRNLSYLYNIIVYTRRPNNCTNYGWITTCAIFWLLGVMLAIRISHSNQSYAIQHHHRICIGCNRWANEYRSRGNQCTCTHLALLGPHLSTRADAFMWILLYILFIVATLIETYWCFRLWWSWFFQFYNLIPPEHNWIGSFRQHAIITSLVAGQLIMSIFVTCVLSFAAESVVALVKWARICEKLVGDVELVGGKYGGNFAEKPHVANSQSQI